MPKANVQNVTRFILTLELTPNELDRLRGMMQNPLQGITSVSEPSEERMIRKAIFDACAMHRT